MKLGRCALPMLITVLMPTWAAAVNCSVSSTPVNFSSYNVFSSTPLDASGTISISCNNPDKKPMQVTVSISSGQSGAFNPRQMKRIGGSDRLNYYLFLDPSKTTVWGDGTGGSSPLYSAISRNSPLSLTVYGRTPARQDVRAGSYGDSLLVTVSW